MRKTLLFLFFTCVLLSGLWNGAILYGAPVPSKVEIRDTSVQTCRNLNILCRVWGFVKYHHPAVDKFDLDAELFTLMPQILQSKDDTERNKILYTWVSRFGRVEERAAVKDTLEYCLFPDNAWIKNKKELGGKLSGLLQKIEKAQRSGFSRYIQTNKFGHSSFAGEKTYDSIPFSDTGYRMLTLFRFWNSMKYYFPYINITDMKWDDVLSYFIPKFIRFTSDKDYFFLMSELTASICDSHGGINIPESSYAEFGRSWTEAGLFKQIRFPVKAKYIEGNLIISEILDSVAITAGLRPGDVILSVDSVSVEDYFNKFGKYFSHSARHFFISVFSMHYLGTNNKVSKIDLIRNDSLITVQFNVDELKKARRQYASAISSLAQNGYSFINDSIGYMYPERMTFEKEDTAMIKFKNTKGIIIDMRCYPQGFFWKNPQYYLPADSTIPVFQEPDYQKPGAFFLNKKVNQWLLTNSIHNKDSRYKGKIILLVDYNTISQSEYVSMWLQAIPGTITIGTPTAGTDGDRVSVPLPYAGFQYSFSSVGILYPDGTPTQRVGIKIDKIVNPTPKGLQQGRDEALEEAVRLLSL